jgi:hypothetical protein
VIRLYGPKILESVATTDETTGELVVVPHRGLDVSQTKTVGQAIEIFTKKFEVEVKPYDGSFEDMPLDKDNLKYFFCEYESDRFGTCKQLADIHVQRGDEDICIKQNLDFELLDGDIVRVQELAC